MKRLLSLLMCVILLAAASAVGGSAADTKQTLTVTDEGRVLAEVEVGNEFIYHVGINTGDYSIYAAQAELLYDPSLVRLVEHGSITRSGAVNMSSYSFPKRISSASLAANFTGRSGAINYNFSMMNEGVGVFSDTSTHFFKVRFQAIAPGTVELHHTMEVLSTIVDGKKIRLFSGGKANEQLDPIPYQLTSAEPATALIGDANGDYDLTVLDATFIQRVTAGFSAAYNTTNADVNADGSVDLQDALEILRYKAGLSTDAKVGEWIFPSEQETESY